MEISRGRRRATKHGYKTMSDAREQFAACEALLNDGAVDACAAAAETLTKQYPKHARAWCLRAALATNVYAERMTAEQQQMAKTV